MSITASKLHETLLSYVKPATLPVGVKLAKKGETPPEKIRYPLSE
jgi:uncharacterized protein (DUF169 family)